MVIVKLRGGRSKETTFIFMTLSDSDTKNIASWLQRKTKDIATEHGYFNEKIDAISDSCLKKFGEKPHVYSRKEIPEIAV